MSFHLVTVEIITNPRWWDLVTDDLLPNKLTGFHCSVAWWQITMQENLWHFPSNQELDQGRDGGTGLIGRRGVRFYFFLLCRSNCSFAFTPPRHSINSMGWRGEWQQQHSLQGNVPEVGDGVHVCCMYMCVHAHVCICACVHICVCTCMFACVCACMCVYMSIHLCVCNGCVCARVYGSVLGEHQSLFLLPCSSMALLLSF